MYGINSVLLKVCKYYISYQCPYLLVFYWSLHFMPYYGLFSHDLHILALSWRSPLCSLLFLWILPLCALLLGSVTHYDITMGDNIVRDAPTLLGTFIMMSQWRMTLLCMALQWLMTSL